MVLSDFNAIVATEGFDRSEAIAVKTAKDISNPRGENTARAQYGFRALKNSNQLYA